MHSGRHGDAVFLPRPPVPEPEADPPSDRPHRRALDSCIRVFHHRKFSVLTNAPAKRRVRIPPIADKKRPLKANSHKDVFMHPSKSAD